MDRTKPDSDRPEGHSHKTEMKKHVWLGMPMKSSHFPFCSQGFLAQAAISVGYFWFILLLIIRNSYSGREFIVRWYGGKRGVHIRGVFHRPEMMNSTLRCQDSEISSASPDPPHQGQPGPRNCGWFAPLLRWHRHVTAWFSSLRGSLPGSCRLFIFTTHSPCWSSGAWYLSLCGMSGPLQQPPNPPLLPVSLLWCPSLSVQRFSEQDLLTFPSISAWVIQTHDAVSLLSLGPGISPTSVISEQVCACMGGTARCGDTA